MEGGGQLKVKKLIFVEVARKRENCFGKPRDKTI